MFSASDSHSSSPGFKPVLTNTRICSCLCQVNYRMHSGLFCLLNMLVSKWAMKPQRDWGRNNEKTMVLHTVFFWWLYNGSHARHILTLVFLWYKATNFWGIRSDCRLAAATDFIRGGQETGLLLTRFRFCKWQLWIHNQWLPLVNSQLVASCQLGFLILLYYMELFVSRYLSGVPVI